MCFIVLKKNKLHRKIHVTKAWRVVFKVKPLGKRNGWGNIIHSSAFGKSNKKYGDRIPGVWFKPNTTRLHICSAVNKKKNHCFTSKKNLPMNKFTRVVIQQVAMKDGRFKYQITINKIVVHKVINKGPRSYKNVKMYASSPWAKPARAVLKNLKFRNLPIHVGE